jgi:hypothetical protein
MDGQSRSERESLFAAFVGALVGALVGVDAHVLYQQKCQRTFRREWAKNSAPE